MYNWDEPEQASHLCEVQRACLYIYKGSWKEILPDVGIDGEVCIQRALKLTNVDLGC